MEFWAVIGLASLDQVFLRQLFNNRESPEEVVRDYGFRLTRWEMGELRRILSLESAHHHLHAICDAFWAEAFDPPDRKPCWWSAAESAVHVLTGEEPYVHPLKNGSPVPTPGHEHTEP